MTAETLQGIHSAAHNEGDPGKFNGTGDISRIQRRQAGTGAYGPRVMTIHTPEGNPVSESDANSLVKGHLSADEVQTRANHSADMNKQSAFESKIRTHMANRGSLPESGTDALASGLPAAGSELGRHISAGFEGGYQREGYRFPHHSGDLSRANPTFVTPGSPRDRSSDTARVVDHR
jgi:hypothetical protein